MSDATTTTAPPPADLSLAEQSAALLNRYHGLRSERDTIEHQMFEILQSLRALGDDRPRWHCRRCGYDWIGHHPNRPPRACARCHSTGWMDDPVMPNARRPSDPPNPKWHKTKEQLAEESRRRVDRLVLRPVPAAPVLPMTPPPSYESVRASLVPDEATRFAETPRPEPSPSSEEKPEEKPDAPTS